MTVAEVDAWLAQVPEPQRTTLLAVRATLARLLPHAEQGLGYGMPVFRVGGKGVAGLNHGRDHCAYHPMSGGVTAVLADVLAGYRTSKGTVRFAADTPLPDDVVARLVEARLVELGVG